jgi:hypothetical protein
VRRTTALVLGTLLGCAAFAGCYVDYYLGTNGSGGSGGATASSSGSVASSSSTTASSSGTGGASGTGGTGGGSATGSGGMGGQCMPGLGGGAPVWSERYVDPASVFASSVAVDADGNVLVVGSSYADADIACGGAMGGELGFAVKLDPSGACMWSKSFDLAPLALGPFIAVDAGGNVLLTGSFVGSTDLGCGAIPSDGVGSLFVAKLDPSGACLWSNSYSTSNTKASAGNSIAVDAMGNVIVAGFFTGSIDFGGTTQSLTSSAAAGSFVAKLDKDGSGVWSGILDNADVVSLAATASGEVWLTGSCDTSFGGFGCAPWTTSTTGGSPIVMHLDADGGCLASTGFSGAPGTGTSIAADAFGNGVVIGWFSGPGAIDLGGGPLAGGGLETVFVAKLGSMLTLSWGSVFGASGSTYGASVAVDASGTVFLAGSFNGSVGFAGAPVPPLGTAGGYDVFVASFDAGGNYRWARGYGDPQDQEAWGIAVDPTAADVLVVGGFQGTLDFGCNPLVSMGGTDVFVAKLYQ